MCAAAPSGSKPPSKRTGASGCACAAGALHCPLSRGSSSSSGTGAVATHRHHRQQQVEEDDNDLGPTHLVDAPGSSKVVPEWERPESSETVTLYTSSWDRLCAAAAAGGVEDDRGYAVPETRRAGGGEAGRVGVTAARQSCRSFLR